MSSYYGKCPRCRMEIKEVVLQYVTAREHSGDHNPGRRGAALTFCCPNTECQAVLNVIFDDGHAPLS
jgi:hypothetical protein